MATEKASLQKMKTRSCSKKMITIERYEYLTKIENEYSEVCRNYKEEQERFKSVVKSYLSLSETNRKLINDLKSLQEMYRGQMNNIVLQ